MLRAMAQPGAVTLREVGPRDGLQAEAPVAVADRVALVEALLDAGVRHIELVSFVSPKAVPSMDGAAEVVAARRASARAWCAPRWCPTCEAPSWRWPPRSTSSTVTVSASEAYSRRNVRMSVEESIAAAGAISALATDAGVPVDAVVSCAFGSPYEGDLAPARRGDHRPPSPRWRRRHASPSPTRRGWRRPAGSTRCSSVSR